MKKKKKKNNTYQKDQLRATNKIVPTPKACGDVCGKQIPLS